MSSARSAVSTVLAMVLAGCAPNPQTIPPVTPVPSPIDLTPDATPLPSATASPTLSVALPRLEWRRIELPNTDFANVTQFGDQFYTIGGRPDGPDVAEAVWRSGDGIEWSKVVEPDLDGGHVAALRPVGDRLFAIVRHDYEAEPFGISTSVWSSRDALSWRNVLPRVDGDPVVVDIGSFAGRMFATTWGRSRLVTWAGSEAPAPALPYRYEVGRPINFAGRLVIPTSGADDHGGRGPSAVMLSTSEVPEWTQTVLDAGIIAEVQSMATNGRVLTALGWARPEMEAFESAAWWSTDGVAWNRATLPEELRPGMRQVRALAWTPSGFIGLSQQDAAVSPHVIWSPDGRAWHLLGRGPIGQVALPRAIPDGDRLLLYLQPYEEDGWTLWEATPA